MQSMRFCKHCSNPINGRPNKKFCSPNCRKRFSEGLQNSFESREKKKRNYILFDSAARLAKIYFAQSPFERLGLMQTYISMAREGNSKMREILSNSFLRSPKNDYGNPYKGIRGRNFGSLAAACERYCRSYWNASSANVVYNRAEEPYDGVVS